MDYDPVSIVFYGPMLPLERGRYQIDLLHSSDAKAGTPLGMFNIRREMREPLTWTDVVAGQPASRQFDQEQNFRFYLEFFYLRNADMDIESVALRRLE
jgi:hypothetical protein